MSGVTERDYQRDAVTSILEQLDLVKSTLCVLPTGTGKTVVFSKVIQRIHQATGKRCLVLAHREELVMQAREEIADVMGCTVDLEMADYRAVTQASSLVEVAPVVVASVQSLCRPARLARFNPADFGLIVVDEAHHCVPQASTYQAIVQHFAGVPLLGVTATPHRADELALGQVFESVAYSYGMADAIRDGWLVPVRQQFVTVESVNLSAVGTQLGDLNQKQVGAVMAMPETVKRVGAAVLKHCEDAPTLVFTVDVRQAELISDFLNHIRPNSAIALSGQSAPEDRRRHIARFSRGEFPYLIGCALFTEGFNVPSISRVVMARPTKSLVYYTQAVGRGTRPLRGVLTQDLDTPENRRAAIAASAKPDVLILDFVGNSGRHKLISTVDIFAGRMEGVAEKVKKQAAKKGEAFDPIEALATETARVEKAEAARVHAATLKAEARTFTSDVDPFSYNDGPSARSIDRASSATAPATNGQREWIEKHGGILPPNATVGKAGEVLAEVKRRLKEQLCSMKQERTLRKAGLITGLVPKTHAQVMIDLLVARNWKPFNYTIDRNRCKVSPLKDGTFVLTIWDDVVGWTKCGKPHRSPEDVRAAYADLVQEVAHA